VSKQFRENFLKELAQKRTVSYEKAVAKFFDRGVLRIERKKWVIVYQDAYITAQTAMFNVGGMVGPPSPVAPKDLPDKVWRDLFDNLMGTGGFPKLQGSRTRNDLVTFRTEIFTYTSSMITLPYTRGRQNASKKDPIGVPYKGNIEARAKDDLISFMLKFVGTSKFIKPAIKSLTTATETEYEHGATGEQDFLQGASSNIRPEDLVRRTALDGKPIEGSVSNAKGAQGVVTDQRIANFLIEACKEGYAKENWFDSAFESIFVKWQDMFGYDTELDQDDKANSVKSTVSFKGAAVPILSKINPGKVDTELLKEFRRFLESKEFFRAETMRLNSMIDAKTADQMFADSPPPSKRMEEAAIKLAATNVLENIQDRVIRKRKKVGKPKNSKKKGSSTKARLRSAARSKVSTKRATVSKKRGRPTKQAQAIGGNVLALKELINKILPDAILAKMQSPALVNRTGRFRRSAEVTNAMIGPRGGVQIDYTYQRNPYEVFEPGSGSPLANQYRDPRKIIGGTVREIAQSIMGKKFVRVRRV
jgi:hypothetical protein